MSFFTSSSAKAQEFEELLRCYSDAAYRMALHLTGGREADAQDLVHDAFVKVWHHWKSQRPISFKGWMYRVMHNLYMDSLRRRKREGATSLDAFSQEGDSPLEERISDGAPAPWHPVEQSEMQQTVARAVASLDPDFRVPVVLCDMEGLPYDEIAKIMSCPLGTVRSRIHRGREQLRRALAHFYHDDHVEGARL